MEIFRCSRCEDQWPAHHFRKAQLEGETETQECVRCEAAGDSQLEDTYKCAQCQRIKKLREFAPVLIKQIIFGAEKDRGASKRKSASFICQRCQYPQCKGLHGRGCIKPEIKLFRPAVLTAYYQGAYLCTACRYPPCACGQERPRDNKGHHKRHYSITNGSTSIEQWTCSACKEADEAQCKICKKKYPKTEQHWDLRKTQHHAWGERRCLQCCYPICEAPNCGRPHPRNDGPSRHVTEQYFCPQCKKRIKCATCCKYLESRHFGNTYLKNCRALRRKPKCADCRTAAKLETEQAGARKVKCKSCGQVKEARHFAFACLGDGKRYTATPKCKECEKTAKEQKFGTVQKHKMRLSKRTSKTVRDRSREKSQCKVINTKKQRNQSSHRR